MSTEQEYRAHVTRTAEVVRAQHFNSKEPRRASDAVLSGAFDRFIGALARMVAFDLHREYGSDPNTSINDLESWHGDYVSQRTRRAITADNFAAMCSAHGIPQEIIMAHVTAGRAYFDTHYSRHLGELFGWVAPV